jgi:hypothetical protein
VPSDPQIEKVVITPESVRDRAQPEILRDESRTERPRLGQKYLTSEHGGMPSRGSNVS